MKLSVIVPTLNEERGLRRSLTSIPPDAEIIVADGRSVDRTRDVAASCGARVVVGRPGRAVQSNSGAEHASGDALLFLHADCMLGPGAMAAIEDALSESRVVGGSFHLRVHPARFALSVTAFGSNLRARLLHLPYGDQALFVRRSVFDELGGYPDIPIMEDVALVRKLKKRGRLCHLGVGVTTTTRHWETLGPLLTTLVNATALVAFLLGMPPSRLAEWYHGLRRDSDAAVQNPTLATGK